MVTADFDESRKIIKEAFDRAVVMEKRKDWKRRKAAMKKRRSRVPVEPKEVPFCYTLKGATEATGLSRTSLYEAFKEGKLVGRKSGRRTLILRADLEAFILSLPLMTGNAAR